MDTVRSGEGWDFSHVLAHRLAVPDFVRDYCFQFLLYLFPVLHYPLFLESFIFIVCVVLCLS